MKRPMLKIKDDDLVKFGRNGAPLNIHYPFNADGSDCPLYSMYHQYIERPRIVTSTNPSELLYALTATRFLEIDPSTPSPYEDL